MLKGLQHLLSHFFQKREDPYYKFLRESPLREIDHKIRTALGVFGYLFESGPQGLESVFEPRNGRVVAVLDYGEAGSTYLQNILVPIPSCPNIADFDGLVTRSPLGSIQFDKRVIDVVIETLNAFDLSTQTQQTSEDTSQNFGMTSYYTVLDQYTTIYREMHKR